jgi:uncharacterized protein YbgA (DUF1722 family)
MARKTIAEEVTASLDAASQLAADAELARLRAEIASYRKRYTAALEQIDRERERADALVSLQGIKATPAKPLTSSVKGRKKHAATAILMLSDVHAEERVLPETVNGENDYSLAVCEQRMQELEQRFLDCLEHERNQADVRRVLIWLGGDFITGHIHPDCAEVAQLSPMNATRWIAERLRRMIDAIAAQAGEVIVCTNAGNHGRSTEKNRIATELEHSWEQLMYFTLAREEQNKNVRWQIAEGHLGYVDLDGFLVRTTHGHSIRFAGGVYGLALPASKAIARWDAGRRASLTIFGHYHSWGWLRGARYIANGSVIGHSPYAERVASPERPCQGMAIVDHGRQEVTRAYPLFCDRDLRKGTK